MEKIYYAEFNGALKRKKESAYLIKAEKATSQGY
jgi:hypothetical protein